MKLVAAAVVFACVTQAQTTQSLIRGEVRSSLDGSPLPSARLTAANVATSATYAALPDASGRYGFPLLSPGSYTVRVEAEGFQAQELHQLDLPVASILVLDFRMRPLDDVWEQQKQSIVLPGKSVLVFFGPDLDTSRTGFFEGNPGALGGSQASVSQVVTGRLLDALPLSGRDAYTLLVTQPGVTADTATSRSLGLSVNGQRPSASNFLLDGLENNFSLVTGPLSPIAPEALQEYRISTNNFSAEYGRTSGFLANAVVRGAGSEWHGLVYVYGKHEALNANGFANNFNGVPRLPARELQPGVTTGGGLGDRRLFLAASFEATLFRSCESPREYTVPSESFLATAPGPIARDLLDRFPPPQPQRVSGNVGTISLEPPSSTNRILALPRLDFIPENGIHRLMGRVAFMRLERPDAVFHPYEGFNTRLLRDAVSWAGSWIYTPRPNWNSEFRAGYSVDDFRLDRPHDEVPTLSVTGAPEYPLGVWLPGSRSRYPYQNRQRAVEIVENLSYYSGRHNWKAGGGTLIRYIDGYLFAYRDGEFQFNNLQDFGRDAPSGVFLPLDRDESLRRTIPDLNRTYRSVHWNLFAQDDIRLSSRLMLSLGIRYDRFGAPVNVGAHKDILLALGPGSGLPEQIAGAVPAPRPEGNQRLYEAGSQDWAARTGVSYALSRNWRTVLRGGYGIFHDRQFDNIWQTIRNNNYVQLLGQLDPVPRYYLKPFEPLVEALPSLPVREGFPEITFFEPMTTPRVHSAFVGIQHVLTGSLFLEANFTASRSRNLLSTDRVNRKDTVLVPPGEVSEGRLNPELPDLIYRANQARSDFHGLSVLARHSGRRALWQVSYSYGRARDNQSDPVLGEFFDLGFSGERVRPSAAFARQFDPLSDEGNAEFDQRHNLVFFLASPLPRPLEKWEVSLLGACRSGFPFTVLSPITFDDSLVHNPADVLDREQAQSVRTPVPGGVVLLDKNAFAAAAPRALGNGGRNSFYGPGLTSLDASLSRRFRMPWLGEWGELAVRVDVFNVMNHANLGNPEGRLGSPDFGVARYGRTPRPNTFRLLGPLGETGRQLQLMLRVSF